MKQAKIEVFAGEPSILDNEPAQKVLRISMTLEKLLSVADVRAARTEIETAIHALVSEFEKRANVAVDGIERREGPKSYWKIGVRL